MRFELNQCLCVLPEFCPNCDKILIHLHGRSVFDIVYLSATQGGGGCCCCFFLFSLQFHLRLICPTQLNACFYVCFVSPIFTSWMLILVKKKLCIIHHTNLISFVDFGKKKLCIIHHTIELDFFSLFLFHVFSFIGLDHLPL